MSPCALTETPFVRQFSPCALPEAPSARPKPPRAALKVPIPRPSHPAAARHRLPPLTCDRFIGLGGVATDRGLATTSSSGLGDEPVPSCLNLRSTLVRFLDHGSSRTDSTPKHMESVARERCHSPWTPGRRAEPVLIERRSETAPVRRQSPTNRWHDRGADRYQIPLTATPGALVRCRGCQICVQSERTRVHRDLVYDRADSSLHLPTRPIGSTGHPPLNEVARLHSGRCIMKGHRCRQRRDGLLQ
jgi:hypothetical protein